MKKYLVSIIGDTNDGDYIENTSIADENKLNEIINIVKEVKKCKDRHNWPMSEYVGKSICEIYPQLSEEQIEMFSSIVPYGEHGIHSIYSISYYEIVGDSVKLF